jgi:single-strand DNA-binding protein
MNDTEITVRGNVTDEPRFRMTESGNALVNFRIASTARRFDRPSGEWVDGDKFFVGVTCWRGLAENVVNSISKGQPIIVHGRISSREYEHAGVNRSSYDVVADGVGHDMSRGTSVFAKSVRAGLGATSVEMDEDGLPPIAPPQEWADFESLSTERPVPALAG